MTIADVCSAMGEPHSRRPTRPTCPVRTTSFLSSQRPAIHLRFNGAVLHRDEIPALTAHGVRELVEEQCPEWAGLGVRWFGRGWDNELFALGDDLLVRLPRRPQALALAAAEHRWLPMLGPLLPVPIPMPRYVGEPSPIFPHPWSIVPLLSGRPLAEVRAASNDAVADDLAGAFLALHRPAPIDAPHNPFRGVPLAARAPGLRDRIAALGAMWLDRWERWRAAPDHPGPAVWLHGDPHPLNLLVHRGRLSALLDWGDVTSGDPASDLATAWLSFGSSARERLIARLHASGRYDPHIWSRAKAWAVALAAVFAASGDAALAPIVRHTLAQLDREW